MISGSWLRTAPGRELNAVADQVVLVCVECRADPLCSSASSSALWHGERVVAELQLAGFLADLVHREIYDPAELVAVGSHMAFRSSTKILSEHTGCLLGGALNRPLHSADEVTVLKAKSSLYNSRAYAPERT